MTVFSQMRHHGTRGATLNAFALLLLLGLCANLSKSVRDCSVIQAANLESTLSVSGLIADSLNTSQYLRNTTILVLDYQIVCLAQGEERDTWRAVSLVANYTFNGTNSVGQFQFECVESNWTATVNGSTQYTRTDPPDASLETAVRLDCAYCVDPRQLPSANNSQHCLACDRSCSQGLQRCTSTLEGSCCNFFLADQCVSSCPNNSLPNSEFICCPEGYQGDNCSQDIDECSFNGTNVCMNYGLCSNTIGGFECNCISGFTGTLCETNINECEEDFACLNGAACNDTFGSYTCNCLPGFTGPNCGTNINKCVEQPCLNGAECSDTPGSYICDCLPGFTGPNCETDINECLDRPCLNGGLCIDGNNTFSCNCTVGWAGSVCDECTLEGCAECINGTGLAVCNTCQDGYTLVTARGLCEVASQPGLSAGTLAGTVIALLLGIILIAVLIALSVGIFHIRKKKRFSAEFRESHIQADQEASWHVMKNPVFENPDLAEGADSGISIESDEHLAVNKAALEFDEDSDES